MTDLIITGPALAEWIGAHSADAQQLEAVAMASSAIVAQLTTGRTVPEPVLKLAALTVASEEWERRNAPNGVRGFGVDGTAVRIGADGTRAARAILAPFLPPTVT